jgi:SAM-dependent methyltransferase
MQPYSEAYYENRQAGVMRSAGVIVPMIMEWVRPASVVDVGCGMGGWLATFARHGVQDFVGADGDYVDRTRLAIPEDRFMPCDLAQPLGLGRTFDLVVSLEVAEHLPQRSADTFVESLTSLGPVVLFSAAIPLQGGRGHVNEQWPRYWADLFDRRGYAAIDCVRRRVWDQDDVQWWYAQNTILYVRRDRLDASAALKRELEAAPSPPLSLVHPKKYVALHQWWHEAYNELQAASPPAAAVDAAKGRLSVEK